MLGCREWVAATVAALMAGLAVVLVNVDDGEVVEVRVQGRMPAASAAVVSSEQWSGRVVWAEKGDVWLYEQDTGERRPLTTDGFLRHDSKPQFRDGARVTYLTSNREFGPDPTLVEFDLASGRSRALQTLPGRVRAYDWSPDGTTLASYAARSDDGATELHITGSGPPRVRRFVPILGRGGFINYDETRIDWSPDGRYLLAQDTALDTSQDETLSILDASGDSARPARLGTWARWSADGRTVYCLCGTTLSHSDWVWQAIDLGSGVSTPLPIPAGARPSLSPNGHFLAFDDGEDTPSVYVLDLRTHGIVPRFLAGAAIAPVWLGRSQLAVTDTQPCPDTEDECIAGGHGSMFAPAGTASAIDVTSRRRSSLPPMSTEGADTDSAAQ